MANAIELTVAKCPAGYRMQAHAGMGAQLTTYMGRCRKAGLRYDTGMDAQTGTAEQMAKAMQLLGEGWHYDMEPDVALALQAGMVPTTTPPDVVDPAGIVLPEPNPVAAKTKTKTKTKAKAKAPAKRKRKAKGAQGRRKGKKAELAVVAAWNTGTPPSARAVLLLRAWHETGGMMTPLQWAAVAAVVRQVTA